MGVVDTGTMSTYLAQSLSSINNNKVNGMLAEVDLRAYLQGLGFGGNITQGGWLFRKANCSDFGSQNIALFPETIQPGVDYPVVTSPPNIPTRLHSLCTAFHQLGILSYHCYPIVRTNNDPCSVQWIIASLGHSGIPSYSLLDNSSFAFTIRARNYNHLRNSTNSSILPTNCIPEEFSKENIRIAFQSLYMSEASDIDGLIWGARKIYPLEIKEKTAANDRKIGDYFGIDIGPFTKLAFYASLRGQMESLYIVREIDDISSRNLVQWHYVRFDEMARYASWVFQSGGTNMQGGSSAVVKIPKYIFKPLDLRNIQSL